MTLEHAIAIAAKGHAGVLDKAGAPYILHPLRVMLSQESNDARIVGVLHDVVEDCEGWTFERLKEQGFSDTVIEALRLVTKEQGKNYDSYEEYQVLIVRTASNPISRAVKMADLRDNLDESRLKEVTPRDAERLSKYRRALAFLEGR